MSLASARIMRCLLWKQTLVFLSLLLELMAQHSTAAIQLQTASSLGCEQLGPVCASSVWSVLQLPDIAFLIFILWVGEPLAVFHLLLWSPVLTQVRFQVPEHRIYFPFIVQDVFRTSMLTFHLVFKMQESNHMQTKKLLWASWFFFPPLGFNSGLFFWSL